MSSTSSSEPAVHPRSHRFRRLHGPLMSSLIVMGGYLLSRVTGVLRDMVIAYQFGTDADLGSYYAAFRVTDLLYMVIIGGALGSSFIPVFIQAWEHDGVERAWRVASSVLTWALTLLVVASVALWIAIPIVIPWCYGGQGFDPQGLALTTRITRLFLLSPLLLGLGGLAMAVLNARDRFTLPAIAPATYNLGIIAGALLLAPTWGVWGLSWGVIIGAAIYLLVQLPGLWGLGMQLRLTFAWGMGELVTILRQMGPRVVGQAASQISLLITAALTARLALGDEKLTGLSYAYQMMLLPYGIFSLSLSTVAFPRLARLFADGQQQELIIRVRRTLSTILFLTLPSASALTMLAVPLVRVLFQRGAFDATSLLYTTAPLLAYATALPAFAASEILIRTFYAMQQTRIPVLIGLLQVSLNLGLGSLALHLGGDVGMLALAFSIANNIEAVLLFGTLGRQLPGLWQDRTLWEAVGSAILATLSLTGLLWFIHRVCVPILPFLNATGNYTWQTDLIPLLLWLATVGLAAASFYGGLAAILGNPDARMLWQRVGKLRHAREQRGT